MATSTINYNPIKTVYYNANTDRTVIANRYTALCDVMDMCRRQTGSVIIATVRYAGGYYHTYIFGPAGLDDVAIEVCMDIFNVWNITRSSGTYHVWGTTLTKLK